MDSAVFGSKVAPPRSSPEGTGHRSDGFGEQRVVEDHSAGTEYTAAEYTGVDQPEDKYRGDGEPPLNRYTLGTDEQPGTTSADLRPEPSTDFRSELPPAPTPDQLDFLVPPPAPRRPEPETHLSPSLPIPMPEPLAPRDQPADPYRSQPEQPTSTSYFAPAPTVSGSGWRTDQTASWSSDQHHHPEPEEPVRAEQPSYDERPIEPPVAPPVDRPVERAFEHRVEQPAEPTMERSVERVPEQPADRAPERPVEQLIERAPEAAPEQAPSATPGATPNTAPDWGVSGGPVSGPRRNEGDERAEADSTIASNPTPAP
ncbi:hypothetical protein E1261_40600, partial [Kribbella albertanoniae]